MARLTENGIRVSKALNVLFQGMARCFDFFEPVRLAFHVDIITALDRELKGKDLSSRDALLYRHYTLAVVYLTFEGIRLPLRYPDPDSLENQVKQEERSAAASDEIHTLRRLHALILLAAAAKGVDCDVCVEVAKKICDELKGELKDEHSIVDLPLNAYLFGNLACGPEFISAMSHAGIVSITQIDDKPHEITFEPLIALALNQELTKCCMSATAFFYRRKHVRSWIKQEHNCANPGQEPFGLEPFMVQMSIEALRLQSLRDVICDAMDSWPLPEVERGELSPEIGELITKNILVKIPTEIDQLSKNQITYLLEYSTDGLKNNIFQKDEKLFRLDKVVSLMCGQLFGILEFGHDPFEEMRRIYETGEARKPTPGLVSEKRETSQADELSKVLRSKYGIKHSQRTIYRSFLDVHKFHYAEIRRRWDKMLADETLGLSSGPAMKQLLAGNLDFMNLA